MNPKISVITISYNIVNEIERTLRSVLTQTYPCVEYVIVDGNSSDGTQAVIENVLEEYPNADVKYESNPDKGIYDAMNKGLQRASGEWVIFMNGGDSFYSDNALESFVRNIEVDTIIAYGDIIKVGMGYQYRSEPADISNMSKFMTVFHQAALTKMNYHKSHLFDLRYRSSADYNFFYHAYMADKVKFQYIPVVLANFDCCHGTSNTNYKRSQRESLKIRGLEKNALVTLKLELWMLTIDLKRFIKRNFLSREKIRDIEVSRLKRIGIEDIKLIPFE